MLKVYVVVSLVITYVKMIISVNTVLEKIEIFCKKCSCTYLLKKNQKYGTKNTFFRKEATNDYFFICFRQVSIEQIQTSIIHIEPCSQEIIDNENPILLRFFLEDAK